LKGGPFDKIEDGNKEKVNKKKETSSVQKERARSNEKHCDKDKEEIMKSEEEYKQNFA
jgi:hypothetical protein